MNNHLNERLRLPLALAGALLLTGVIIACQPEKKGDAASSHTHESATGYYTCSMHPQVVQDKPGKCPICQMDLVKVVKKAVEPKDSTQSPTMLLSAEQIQLANIRVDTVGYGSHAAAHVLTGTLAANVNQSETISSRVEGRIEKLYFKQNGERVQKGAPLYEVYSEQLQILQNEYLLALAQEKELGDQQGRYGQLLEGASQKLRLLGMNTAQLNKLASTGQPSPTVTFYSPQTGVIQDIAITEGQYVGEGSLLFSLTDLSTLWVEAQLYPNEMGTVEIGTEVSVQVTGFSQSLKGKVTFLNPALEENSQVWLVRAEISNPTGQLLPGMQANVVFRQTGQTLTLPLSAVLRDSKGSYVWKQSGEGTFTVAMVETGNEDAQTIQITSGVSPGDRVVTSGAYLLNSEYILKKGASPMEEHHHAKIM